MTWGISNNPLASSIAGTDNAKRSEAADKKRKADAPKPRKFEDTFEETRAVTELDPSRTVKGNTQEEAHEDRQEHGTDGLRRDGQHRALDVEG